MKVRQKRSRRSQGGLPHTALAVAVDRFNAAVRLHVVGVLDAALEGYEAIIAQWPAYAEAHHNAGTIHAQRGALDHAISCFRRAIDLRPGYAEAHHSLGLALHMSGSPRPAIESFRRAAELNPTSIDWWTDLATALTAEGFFVEGLAANDRALALDPSHPQSLANRAVPLRGLHRHREAIEACRASLAVRPQGLDTMVNLGMILRETGDFAGARRAFDDVLSIFPGHHKARANIATLLLQTNHHKEARAIAEQLVTEQPNAIDGWTLLGICALEAADYALAEQCQREALARSPDNCIALWNLAQLTLIRGDLAEGFQQFEARKQLDVFTRYHRDVPEWTGESLHGGTLLVHAEQGFGDTIHFIRFLPLLKERGIGRVVVDECPPEIASLLRTAPGVDELVVRGDPSPRADARAYLLSLPFILGTTLETIPATVPYLAVPERPVGAAIWEQGEGLRVGLVWAGNAAQTRDRIRSVGLAALAPVLATPGVTFFSLQKGDGVKELAGATGTPIVNLDPVLRDFRDTATAIATLDLVITIDTSVAHLAGALGKPVWALHAHVPDWRWFLGRDDSPWYPTMRLFRQPTPNDWATPVQAVAAALAELVRAGKGSASPARAFAVSQPASVAPMRDLPRTEPNAAPAAASRRPIEIDWPIGLTSGWGTYGLQLALALSRSPRAEPILAAAPTLHGVSPLVERQVRGMLRTIPSARATDAVHLTALGNQIRGTPPDGRRRDGKRAGVIFFEDTAIDAEARERAHSYDVIIAGSTWNLELLKAFGIPHVRLVLQGVDPSLFHPAPRTGVMGDRFLVFSGGKLEFRKGQDIIVEAFRRFSATHPDALLVTAWHNHWPQSIAGIEAMGYVRGAPVVRNGRCDIAPWLAANGLSPDTVLDLGEQPQPVIAQVLREMDVAVFTNRGEGGTNLVAMEAMACGVPTILSANTGHLNLIGRDTCFPLERQPEISVTTPAYAGMLCWGESDPDEVVALLERAYDDRVEARRRGAIGAALLAQLPWPAQAAELLRQLDV